MTPFAAVANHIWQSTVFALIVALAALVFRRNRAAVRHGLWLAASAKFLVPFAALVALGGAFGTRARAPILQRDVTIVLEVVGQPFTGSLPVLHAPPTLPPRDTPPDRLVAIAGVVWLTGVIAVLATWLVRRRRVAAIVRASMRVDDGPELAALRRLERRAGLSRPIPMVASPAPLEPGVFGIFRPVLIWPASIGAHLNADQLVTILSHEVAHVRRRDNLAAAIQTFVEALFWFHPLVWWIGARLVEERERACDEDVVRAGGEPEVYAETILTACRVFLEAPHACVAGVTGSDLKKRIERIMNNTATRRLTTSSKLLLTAGTIGTLLVPVGVGAVNAPRARVRVSSRQVNKLRAMFEVAAVKPNKSGPGPVRIQTSPGGRFVATNVTLKNLIQFAYRLQSFQVVGGPDWLNTVRFDIAAKGDETDDANQFLADQQSERPNRVQLRVQSLLEDRFKLVVRTETDEQPMYWLVLARSDGRLGTALRQSTVDCGIEKERSAQNVVKVPLENVSQPPCGIRMGMGSILVGGATLTQFAGTLAGMLERTVVDRTGLTGTFDATLKFTPDQSTPGFAEKARYIPTIDPDGPSIFTALQEQLGLKLDARKGQVDVLRIVSADQPTPN
jgi:uncharacterized protein (TIGR03435 family)